MLWGDGTIIHEDAIGVGKQYTFVKDEMMSYGAMVHLEEFPHEYGYQAYLFEELQSYDAKILKDDYRKWLEKKLSKILSNGNIFSEISSI